MKICWQQIERILEILDNPKYVQRLAFGVKLIQLIDGEILKADSIKVNSIRDIVEEYVSVLVEEIADGLVEVPEDRCTKCHQRYSSLQCLQQEGHYGSHKYTPKGKISPETLKNFVKSLTAGELFHNL